MRAFSHHKRFRVLPLWLAVVLALPLGPASSGEPGVRTGAAERGAHAVQVRRSATAPDRGMDQAAASPCWSPADEDDEAGSAHFGLFLIASAWGNGPDRPVSALMPAGEPGSKSLLIAARHLRC